MPSKEKSKYCGFHQDYDHTIKICIQLKRTIVKLICERHLKEYVTEQPNEKAKKVIEVITFQFFSITQIKQNIHNLNKPIPMLHFDRLSHNPITFFDQHLKLNEGALITPIILEVGMATKGIDKC